MVVSASAPSSTPQGSRENELERRIAELTVALDARDSFIAVAAHELRNPITPVVGQIELLLRAIKAGGYPPAQVEQRLERISASVRHFVKRAEVLLNVSRINAGKFDLQLERCDLSAVMRSVVDQFSEEALRAGVPISLTVPDSLWGMWDRLALEQIVDNLTSNALKYGARSPIEIAGERSGDQVRITIRDYGNGIPVGERELAFGRFERVMGRSKGRSGFGVGLWMVRVLSEAMEGKVEIEDAPGGGALFIVTLPGHLKGAPP